MVRQRDLAPGLPSGLQPDPSLPKVCVIGAGSSGLAAAKALYEAVIVANGHHWDPQLPNPAYPTRR